MRLTVGQATDVRLGRQRAPQYETGANIVPYLRSANISDGTLDLRDVKSMNFSLAEQRIFTLAAGDVLMTEGSGSRETVGTSAVWRDELPAPVCFQNTLLRLRPREGVTDGRFVAWWARHAHLSGQIAAVSSGANILHIGSDGLKRLQIDVPSLDEQRRIADFLDDRTSRIDHVVAARRMQASLAVEAFRSSLEDRLWTRDSKFPLKHLLVDVTSGPRGWGEKVGNVGEAFVRIANLASLGIELRSDNLARVDVPEGAEAQRAQLRQGDVLLSITAVFGEVAVWRAGAGTFSQHVARLRPKSSADSDWIAWILQSSSVHDQYRVLAYGGTKVGMGLDQVRNLKVPSAGRRERSAIARGISHAWAVHEQGQAALVRSIDRLIEYKQSLITAAVNGELDVTTAGSGSPG